MEYKLRDVSNVQAIQVGTADFPYYVSFLAKEIVAFNIKFTQNSNDGSLITVSFNSKQGVVSAISGDYIVKKDNSFFIMKERDFESLYKPVIKGPLLKNKLSLPSSPSFPLEA